MTLLIQVIPTEARFERRYPAAVQLKLQPAYSVVNLASFDCLWHGTLGVLNWCAELEDTIHVHRR